MTATKASLEQARKIIADLQTSPWHGDDDAEVEQGASIIAAALDAARADGFNHCIDIIELNSSLSHAQLVTAIRALEL